MSILEKRETLGKEKGIQQGIQQGAEKEKIKIAKNLLKENADITLVAKATGLTQSEVKKIKEELNH